MKGKNDNIFEDNKLLPLWYGDNRRPIYTVPPQLAWLTLAEKLLIQRISPFVPLQHIRQSVMGLKGHGGAFKQNINNIMTTS